MTHRHTPWLLAGLALVAACGGRAALEAYELGPGGGGAGGKGGTGGASSATMASSSSSSGPGAMTAVSSSSSSGGGFCDNSGDCSVCADCAAQSECFDAIQACFSDIECTDFATCLENTGNFPQCAQLFPLGAQLYITAIQCLVCDACEVDCAFEGQQVCPF